MGGDEFVAIFETEEAYRGFLRTRRTEHYINRGENVLFDYSTPLMNVARCW